MLAHRYGEHARSDTLFAEGLALFQRLQDQRNTGRVLTGWGRTARNRGDYRRASQLGEEGLTLLRAVGDHGGISWALLSLADVALDQGDVVKARAQFQEALAVSRKAGDSYSSAWALINLGRIAYVEGDHARATALLEDSRDRFRELGDYDGVAQVLVDLGHVARVQGDIARATALYQESLAVRQRRQSYDVGHDARCLEGLAAAYASSGRAERAARLFGAAEALREAHDAPLPPLARAAYEQDVTAAHTPLDNATLVAAKAEGRAMTLEQAVAYALSDES